ncbi:MAG: 3-deoxy-D-manno-octulosonic acid transferase [Bacteroidales bacterium]|nr:3-deoxy-D-manno-octulosonic acid transferase [Bacteroidales bacterium]
MSSKLYQFFKGRAGQFERIEKACKGVEDIIWVHAASYGEFEEARPVIEAIRARESKYRFLVTFFSPSGYEHLKNDPVADFVFYIPIDTKRNARRFLDLVRPVKVIVSISDYWLNFLHELRDRNIPTYLISARFLPDMAYFKPIGKIYLDAFRTCFTKIIVNSEPSFEVLKKAGLSNVAISGDPRLDRVNAIAAEQWSDALVERWCDGHKVFVAGSTLPDEDDECIIAAANRNPGDKFLIIPHEQGKAQISHLLSSIKGGAVLYTDPGDNPRSAQALIVDTVGMLSRLYRYGFASFVGSGFSGESPHSIIEPAAYGIPVSFGPLFGTQQTHCTNMIAAGAAVAVKDREDFCEWYSKLKNEPHYLDSMGKAAAGYCRQGGGVADSIASMILGYK